MRYLTWALIWIVATVLAGGVTWTAVAWSEKEPVGGVNLQRPLTGAAVRRDLSRLAVPRPTAHKRSTGDASTRPTEVHRPRTPTHAPRTGSWQTAGGSVAARCRANHIELLYASPANGWAYHVGPGTTGTLTVQFTGPQAVSTFRARCAGGTPLEVSATSSSRVPPSDSESGD